MVFQLEFPLLEQPFEATVSLAYGPEELLFLIPRFLNLKQLIN